VLNAAIGSAGTGAIAINGTLTGAGNIVTGTGALTIAQDGNSTYDGVISGTQGLVKTGAGTLSLPANQTFSGTATVNGGTLAIGGTLAGGATVGSGGALTTGTSTIGGPVAVSGNLAPGGNGTAFLGMGNLSFGTGGLVIANLNGTTTPGTDYDQISATGSVNLTNGGLRILVGTTSTLALNDSFTLVANDAADAVTGQFANGSEIAAFDNPRYRFTVNTGGGDGNDVVLTLSTILPPRFLDLSGGTISYSTGTGIDSSVSVGVSSGNYTLTDTAGVINLSAAAVAAGWTGDGSNTVTGPVAGVIALVLNLSDGSDSITGLTGGTAPVTVNAANSLTTSGSLTPGGTLSFTNTSTLTLGGTITAGGAVSTTGIGTLNVNGTVTAGGAATLTAANITAGASSLVSARTVTLTATNAVGTSADPVRTQAATIAVTAGAGGAFVREADGAAIAASTTGSGDLSIANDSGTLSVASPITTVDGDISLASDDGLVLGANITSGTGTIALAANTDGAGTDGFDQGTALLTTGNTSATSVAIAANTAAGGTGNASVFGVSTAGTLVVNAHGGSILYAGTTTLPNPVGGTAPPAAELLRAGRYVFTATGAGSIGTVDRPLQSDNLNAANTAAFAAGDGGIYWSDWGSTAFNLESAIATGPGNIQVFTANAGGHNLIVGANGLGSPTTVVSTGTGSIFLAADDDFTLNTNAVVGGAGFSGTVEMVMNRDAGNGQSLLMLNGSAIVTTNNSANAVRLTGNAGAGSAGSAAAAAAGVGGGGISLSNITVGTGGTITVNAAGGTSASRLGSIVQLPGTVLDAGASGTVNLIARAGEASGSTNATAGFGQGNIGIGGTTAAPIVLPVRVSAGTVTAVTNGTTLGNTGSINIVGVGTTGFSAVTAGRPAATVALSTETGVLTVTGPVSTDGGIVSLTSTGANGGVSIKGPIGDADTSTVTINAGVNKATVDTAFSLPSNLNLSVTAANGLEITSTGTLAGTGAAGNTTPVTGRTGGTISPAGTGTGTLNVGNLALGAGSILLADLNGATAFDQVNITGTADVTGSTLNLMVNATLAVNDAFTILANDGSDPVVGQFAGGTTIRALDPRYQFTINYAGGDGNDVVATVTAVTTNTLLDVSAAGVVTVSSATGLDNNVTVSHTANALTLSDTAGVIELTAEAIAAGWTGGGTNTVTGPTAGVTQLVLLTNSGADALADVSTGSIPLTVNGTGSVAVNGPVASDASVTIAGVTDITGTGSIAGSTLALSASNGIGTSTQRLSTSATALVVSAGNGGAFLAEANGADLTGTVTGTGNLDVVNAAGTLNVAGPTSTVNGNILFTSADAVTIGADLNAGAGTIAIAANTDGAGAQGYDQKGASLLTTNATAGAVSITVNTAGGGTGDAVIGLGSIGTNAGGTITVASNGGNILWSADPIFAPFGASQTGLSGGGSNTQTLKAYSYSFTTGATGSVGTDVRPLQLDNFGANGAVNVDPNLTAAAGSGGVYAVVWDSAGNHDLTTGTISAQGAGNIRVVTANAGGHNFWVNGLVSTGSGNIYLAADDNLEVEANVVIGGPGFSGTVWMQANRDQSTAGQTFTMTPTSAIVTSSTVNVPTGPRTPNTQAVYLDISGDTGNPSVLSVANVTTGDGGRIVLNAIPNGIAAEAGRIILSDATNLVSAGPTGTVELVTGITAAAAADAVGVSATLVRVAAGTVVVNSTFGNVNLVGTGPTAFAVSDGALASQTGTGPAVNLTTAAGAMTVTGLTTVAGGPIALTGAGGVVLNGAIGGSAGDTSITGALSGSGNIALGTGGLTVTQDTDSTYAGAISGAQAVTKKGTGTLTLAGANTYTGGTTVSAGGLLAGNSSGSATGTGTVTAADGTTVGGSGAITGSLTTSGTLSLGAAGNAAGHLSIGSVSFGASGARVLALDLNGLAAGTGYDQLDVTGTIDLTGATLILSAGSAFRPLLGSTFVVLANDGTDPITGTLANLSEGATLDVGTRTYQVSYIGGDGNDLTFKVTSITSGPPVNTVPGDQETHEDTDLVFSAANGNAISVDDPAFGGPLKLTLTATNGTLTLSGITGLAFTQGDGTADAAMTFTGEIAAIQAALAGLRFTPTAEFSGPATITVTSDDQGGTGGAPQSDTDSVAVTVLSVNDAPTFTRGADQTVNEDAGAQIVPGWATAISPGPANESGQTVSFQVTTDNNSLFAVLPAVSPTGTLTFTPANDAFGTATVTVVLSDNGGTANGGQNTSAPQTFTITVNAVNDVPSFTKGADQTISEDAGAQTVSGWATAISAGPANEAGQILSFQVNTDNDALFSALPAIAPNGTLTFTPAANEFGTATVTVIVNDDGGTANGGQNASLPQTFTITVNSVNDAPSFTRGTDQTVSEDAGAQTIPGWATSISTGPANESGQSLTFGVTTDNNALFSALPAIAPNGTLTFTPAANAFGTATVTVILSDNGGTAGGGVNTSPPQTFTITVNSVNDAPVLSGDGTLTPIPRNSTNPAGNAVADFAGVAITDVDVGALEGIAIVGSTGTAAQGTWQFSTDNGQTWSPLGTPSTAAARLLRATDRVRFVPATGFIGSVVLTYNAWDQTTGTAGGTADLTAGTGGTTAFSNATASASLQVGVSLTAVPEDTRSPRGNTVGSLLTSLVIDPDLKAKSGIAVVGVDGGTTGTWQYSTNAGLTWKPLNASPYKALLLRSTDKVRFVPAPNASGVGTFEFHAWDQTFGKAGGTADLTAGTGAGTAFSTARAIGFVEVTAVNDRPVLDLGGEPPLTRVLPTATDPAGDLVRTLLGASATDAERDAIGIAVTAATGKGTWQFQPAGAPDWTNLGTVSAKAPKFLGPLDRIRFVPTSGIAGAAKLTYKAWDGTAVSKLAETGTVLVTADPAPAPNTAPVLNTAPNPALTSVAEDTKSPAGDTVASLLGQAVTDPDAGALHGIAITRLTGTSNGTWQYSTTNGRIWLSIGAVSDANALLLRDTDRIRFRPGKDFNGTATVTYQAWDRTRGTAGARADLTAGSGGTTPYSVAAETASIVVTPVNDIPVLNIKPTPTLTPVLPTETDPPGDLVSRLVTAASDVEGNSIGIAVTLATGNGTWQFQLNGSATWTDLGVVSVAAPKFLAPTDRIRFLPTGGASGIARLLYKAWDGTAVSAATESVSLPVNSVDDRPVLNTAGNPTFTPVRAGDQDPAGDLVSALLGTAATDADPGADLGIAVTVAPTTAGTWEVMTNGTTWEALGPVSSKAPRLLRSTDRIRFIPNAGFVGSVKLSFKAWDAGSANPNGPLALSAATETAVVVVNTAPILQV